MLRKHSLVTALGFLVLLGTVEVANARIFVTTFAGTRGQVSAACTGPNRTLMEGIDNSTGMGFSWCTDNHRNTSVVCDDGGSCVGSYGTERPDRSPRGPKGAPQGGRVAGPGQSLSEPVGSIPSQTSSTSEEQPGVDVVIY